MTRARSRWALTVLLTSAVAGAVGGCDRQQKSLEDRAKAAASSSPGGLTPEQAARVIAKVGDRTITLGEYAATLERMNEFDRMRYQAPEKRKELLQEMIDLELLATEARRRGLDKTPAQEELRRQILRDALLAEARKGLPLAQELPIADVRKYFDTHRDEFREPERRRVAAFGMKDKALAERSLADAKRATAMEWGRLALKLAEPKLVQGPSQPVESVADLGIVGPPDDPKGDHPRVPDALRRAVFEVKGDVGAVLDQVISADGRWWIVRLAGRSDAHERSFAEAERSIRGILVQQLMHARTKALEAELEKQFPVSIDEAELAKISGPAALPSPSSSHAAPPVAASR